MRKLNIITVIGMLITLLLHAVFGSLQMIGIGNTSLKVAAWILVGFVTAHMIIGIILTIKTLYAQKQSGAGYFKQNTMFWAARLSGFVVILFIIAHLLIFRSGNAEAYRLAVFNGFKLATQILLVVSIAIHVITNVKPMLMSFGIKGLKPYAGDIIIIISIILALTATAFIIYFIRWSEV